MTKSEFLEVIKNSNYLESIPVEFQDDREVIIEAIKKDSNLLQDASKNLRSERHIVKIARTLEFSTDTDLINDLEFVREMIRVNPDSLLYASESIRDMEFVVLDAIRRGACLNCASKRLQDNKSLVLIAVESNPDSYLYTSQRLRSDVDVILTVLDTYDSISFDEDTTLFNNEWFPALLYSKYPDIYHAHPSLLYYYRLKNNWPISFKKYDKEYVDLKYWKDYMIDLAYPEYFNEMPIEYFLENTNSKIFRCMLKHGSAIPEYDLNDELVLAAISSNEPIDHNVSSYIEFEKMDIHFDDIEYLGDNYDKEFLVDAVTLNKDIFLTLKGNCRKDLDIVIAAIKKDPSLVQYVHPEVKKMESYKIFIDSLNT